MKIYSIKNKIRNICKQEREKPVKVFLLLLTVYILFYTIYPLSSEVIFRYGRFYNLHSFIDTFFPFQIIWVFFYCYWYFFMAALPLYILLGQITKQKRKTEYGEKYQPAVFFPISMIILMALSYLIFFLIPATCIRPSWEELEALRTQAPYWQSPFFSVLSAIYKADHPVNVFPSIHVASSVLYMLEIKFFYIKKSVRSILAKYFIYISVILISLSTLFIKQHYFADIIMAIIIAYTSFYISKYLLS